MLKDGVPLPQTVYATHLAERTQGGLSLETQPRPRGSRNQLGPGGRAGVSLTSQEAHPKATSPSRLGPAGRGKEARLAFSLCYFGASFQRQRSLEALNLVEPLGFTRRKTMWISAMGL